MCCCWVTYHLGMQLHLASYDSLRDYFNFRPKKDEMDVSLILDIWICSSRGLAPLLKFRDAEMYMLKFAFYWAYSIDREGVARVRGK